MLPHFSKQLAKFVQKTMMTNAHAYNPMKLQTNFPIWHKNMTFHPKMMEISSYLANLMQLANVPIY